MGNQQNIIFLLNLLGFILNNLDREKYEIDEAFIDEQGNWYNSKNKSIIENITSFIKNFDVVFPILLGSFQFFSFHKILLSFAIYF